MSKSLKELFTPPKEAEGKVMNAYQELVKALQKQGKSLREDKPAS
jgi:hypothetical protein